MLFRSDVSQDTIISEYDCGTRQGVEMMPLIEGGEIIERLGDRILGRVVLEDIVDPYTGEVLVASGAAGADRSRSSRRIPVCATTNEMRRESTVSRPGRSSPVRTAAPTRASHARRGLRSPRRLPCSGRLRAVGCRRGPSACPPVA